MPPLRSSAADTVAVPRFMTTSPPAKLPSRAASAKVAPAASARVIVAITGVAGAGHIGNLVRSEDRDVDRLRTCFKQRHADPCLPNSSRRMSSPHADGNPLRRAAARHNAFTAGLPGSASPAAPWPERACRASSQRCVVSNRSPFSRRAPACFEQEASSSSVLRIVRTRSVPFSRPPVRFEKGLPSSPPPVLFAFDRRAERLEPLDE